jgi:Cft2 family RNA processing exonuclease
MILKMDLSLLDTVLKGRWLGYISVELINDKHMVSEPSEIVALSGQKIPRRISVEEISFAAHVDYTHNSQFIEMIDANYIVFLSFLLA